MYDSDFVSTVKVTGSLEWPFARLVRMNSFQPTADERYDIPTKTGCSSLYTDRLMPGMHAASSVRLALLLHGHPDGNVPGIANADE
jgi:hypothetical protein